MHAHRTFTGKKLKTQRDDRPGAYLPFQQRATNCELTRQKNELTFQFSSVAQSCPTLCDPINCSAPGLSVHHQLPEFTQTHVHGVGDAIQSSHPLLSPSLMRLLREMEFRINQRGEVLVKCQSLT